MNLWPRFPDPPNAPPQKKKFTQPPPRELLRPDSQGVQIYKNLARRRRFGLFSVAFVVDVSGHFQLFSVIFRDHLAFLVFLFVG